MESRHRAIYHLRDVSLNGAKRNLHFKVSKDPMMDICMLMEATCLCELLWALNLANECGLKFFGTGASHMSSERG